MPLSDFRTALAPLGYLRVGINLGNPVLAQGNASAPRGPSVDLATALAQRLGVASRFTCHDAAASVVAAAANDDWDLAFLAIDPARADRIAFSAPYLEHDAAASVVAAAANDDWDLAFLAIDPARADRIAFSAPYLEIEGTYLVRDDSPAQQVADLDRHGMRIAVGRGAAYDLFLSRALQHARIERADTSAAAIALFDQQRMDAAAGVRQPLQAWAALHPGHRVLADRFTAIAQAVAAPAARPVAALQALFAEVDAIRQTSLLAEAFDRAGQQVTLLR